VAFSLRCPSRRASPVSAAGDLLSIGELARQTGPPVGIAEAIRIEDAGARPLPAIRAERSAAGPTGSA